MALKEYKPGTTFPGVVGRTADVSQPAWPEPRRAQCPLYCSGRYGLRPVGLLRQPHQHPQSGDAPSKHNTQYFEMFGHRSIYHDGWRAVCPWPGASFSEAGKQFGAPMSYEQLTELDAEGWELYHVAEDFAETQNVAGDQRARLIEMIGQWYPDVGKGMGTPGIGKLFIDE